MEHPDLPGDIIDIRSTGSQVVPGAAHKDSDYDFVVLTKDRGDLGDVLIENGWVVNTDNAEYDCNKNREYEFLTARLGSMNLIIYDDKRGFDLWVKATELSIQFGLTKRDDRVALYRAILNDRR